MAASRARRSDRPAARPGSGARERTIGTIARQNVPTVLPEAPLSALPDLFSKSRTPAVVVVDERGQPRGVITPADLFAVLERHGPQSLAQVDMTDVAKAPSIYLRLDTRLSSALRLFVRQKLEFIVVVDDAGTYLGVVSHAELLAYLAT